jgi:Helix-turn-helix domain
MRLRTAKPITLEPIDVDLSRVAHFLHALEEGADRGVGGVPKSTLDQWAYLGTGPRFVKIGRHRRYDPRDVEAWIESRKHGGEADA